MKNFEYVAGKDMEYDNGLLPTGDYLAIIESSDYIPAKNGKGMMLKLVYKIIDGEFTGRKIFENLNLQHLNPQAEAIARKSLNSICVALEIKNIGDSSELHDKPLKVHVKITPERGYYEPMNIITKHESVYDKNIKVWEKQHNCRGCGNISKDKTCKYCGQEK